MGFGIPLLRHSRGLSPDERKIRVVFSHLSMILIRTEDGSRFARKPRGFEVGRFMRIAARLEQAAEKLASMSEPFRRG
jgi:hypothetical protein